MKKHKRTLLLCLATGIILGTNISCSSDDNTKTITEEPTKPKPVEPAAKASITLSIKEINENSITLTLTTANASEVYYLVTSNSTKDEILALKGEEIIKKGKQVNDLSKDLIINELESDIEYIITAVAKNSEGEITLIETPLIITTLAKIDVEIKLTEISASHEQIFFTLTPTDAVQANYKIVEKGTVLTADEILETGSKIYNLKSASTLKPKGFKPNTDYTIYAAGLSATGAKVLSSAEVKTSETPTDPVDDGIVKFTTLTFTADNTQSQGGKVTYYKMSFIEDTWEATFEIGAVSSNTNELPEGKYILPARQDEGKPGPERIAKDFIVKNKKTGEIVKDIDYGDIIITKQDTQYNIIIDMVKLNYKERFKGDFKGTPIKR